jgi:hypothetical protein
MFNELPGFFDRNFIVGFFLPALIFVLVGFGLMFSFDIAPKLTSVINDDLYKGATIIGVISWIISIFLLSLNFSILRFFEGYGKYNPLQLLQPIYEKKFFQIEEEKFRLGDARRQAEELENDEELTKIKKRQREVHRDAADLYPMSEARVLPTAFGNAIRAFEDYTEEMYGLDAIVSWVRLLAVIPKDFREMTSTARAEVDMWINFRLLSYVLIIAYLIMAFSAGQFRIIWFPAATFAFAFFASIRATKSAVLWGDFIKASYDLYLPDLREQIRLPEKKTNKEEKQLWNKFVRQVTYHDKEKVLERVSSEKNRKNTKKDSSASEE